jgi:hypothetical protein
MSGCRIIRAHNHELIRQRVEDAISGAAEDIAELIRDEMHYGQPGDLLTPEFYVKIRDIIVARAYYGDSARNGQISDDDLMKIKEFAGS